MALLTCPECGNTISDKATRCPKCGCPARQWQNHNEPSPPPAPNCQPFAHQQPPRNCIYPEREKPIYVSTDNGSRNALVIILIIVVFLVSCFGIWIYFQGRGGETNTDTKVVNVDTITDPSDLNAYDFTNKPKSSPSNVIEVRALCRKMITNVEHFRSNSAFELWLFENDLSSVTANGVLNEGTFYIDYAPVDDFGNLAGRYHSDHGVNLDFNAHIDGDMMYVQFGHKGDTSYAVLKKMGESHYEGVWGKVNKRIYIDF